MTAKKIKMKGPKGIQSAFIEGHDYEVAKDGTITVVSNTHIETLKRQGFVDHEDEVTDEMIDEMDDKQKLVEFIEERGGEADDGMGLKKLRRLAKEARDEHAKD